MALAIMHQDGAVVVDGHLGETRRRVHQGVNQGSQHGEAEEANHGVILVHVAGLGLLCRSALHSYSGGRISGVEVTYPLWLAAVYRS